MDKALMFRMSFGKKFSPSRATRSIGRWWIRWSHVVFFVAFLLVIVAAVFSWYWSIHLFRWSAGEEREYRQSRDTQVKFQEERFKKTLELLDARREKWQAPPGDFRDIFLHEEKR